jgi:hypothetical protein
MDYYVISPVSNLEPMLLGDRIFALAHLWVQYPHYREFILEQKKQGKFITLDNSAAERALVTEDVLIDICKQLIPNEVIAPDVLFDKDATISNARSFRNRLHWEGLDQGLFNIDIFFCPQGKTKQDWLEAYKWGLEQDWIKTIGFSKIAIPQAWLSDWKDDQGIKEARHMAYDYLKEQNLLLKPIHCLGQGSYTEFAYYNHPMMRSTDSVYPVLAAAHGIDFTKDSKTRIPTPHNFLETFDMSTVDMELVKSNVNQLEKSCRGEIVYAVFA